MLAEGLVSPESTASNRAIRVYLGERLRAYYECMQHTPVPDRLAELIDHLVERLEGQESKGE
jgi:Anti-sigma factor NepR